jgi:hypothetical protein
VCVPQADEERGEAVEVRVMIPHEVVDKDGDDLAHIADDAEVRRGHLLREIVDL